jgi:transposase-like protein
MGPEEQPVGGVDYPRTFQEFDARFSSEAACREYLVRVRWPSGFRCKYCGIGTHAWSTARGLLHCRECGKQTSATAGTVFEGTHKPLRTWFLAMWFVTSQKHGASALGLQRVLGLGSYQTAWGWLHKLRRAMVRPGRDKLSGTVEVDETYIGGPADGVRGRGAHDKALVVIAAEERGVEIGRIRLGIVDDASGDCLIPFVREAIAPGSTVHTDSWRGYSKLPENGYQRKVTNIKQAGARAHALLPRVHRVASLLKRWLLGTHHGGVQIPHLAYYLDEFTFRFNRRTSRSRGLLFHRLVQQAVATAPSPYAQLIGGKPQPVGGT